MRCFNEGSLARRKCETIQSVGGRDQDETLAARPGDDGRACELESDVRRLDRFQLAHAEDRKRGCRAVFFGKTTDRQRVVARNRLSRRESLHRVTELQVRRVVRALVGPGAEVLVPSKSESYIAPTVMGTRGLLRPDRIGPFVGWPLALSSRNWLPCSLQISSRRTLNGGDQKRMDLFCFDAGQGPA